MSKFRDFEKYDVFEDGRIYSYKRKKFLKPKLEKDGYQRVGLYDNEGKRKWYQLHRVVYEAASGEKIPECMQVNHINENKEDNRFCNLNLMTCKDNINFGTGIQRRAKSQSKQLCAFKDDELIMTFPSTKEAGRQGFDQGAVAACCRGERKTHKGYTWRYI